MLWGSAPDTRDQTYGAVPPEAARVALYGVPVVPAGSVDVLMVRVGAAAATTTLKVAEPCSPIVSLTWMLKVNVPAAEGVPVSAPVEAIVNPGGNWPEDNPQTYGGDPLEAVNGALYATPTVAPGILVVRTTGGTFTVMLKLLEACCPALSITLAINP